jgi:hypothetical protein
MSLKNFVGVVAFGSAVAVSLYGVGCGSSSPGGGAGKGGGAGSGSGGSTGSGSGGSTGSGTGGSHGTGSGGSTGVSPFPDAGDGGGSTCAPGSVTGAAVGLNPSGFSVGCTATEVSNIFADCISSTGSSSACSTLLTGSTPTKDCYLGCVFSDWTAVDGSTTKQGTTWTSSPWGALVFALSTGTEETTDGSGSSGGGEINYINTGGCYTAVAPTDTGAQKCATDLQESIECGLTACLPSCVVPTPPGTEECTAASDPSCFAAQSKFFDCTDDASKGGCAKYNTAAMTDCAAYEGDSGTFGQCNAIQSALSDQDASVAEVDAALLKLVNIICLGNTDGG